jgi:hypothetical protein
LVQSGTEEKTARDTRAGCGEQPKAQQRISEAEEKGMTRARHNQES